MLLALLMSVIPMLVSAAEAKFGGGGTGASKKAWVGAAIDDLEQYLLKHSIISSGIDSAWQSVKGSVDGLIEDAVAKIDP